MMNYASFWHIFFTSRWITTAFLRFCRSRGRTSAAKFRKNIAVPLLVRLIITGRIYKALVQTVRPVLRFVSAATGARGPRPWRGFTHGPQTTAKFP